MEIQSESGQSRDLYWWVRQQKFEDACRQCVLDDNIKAVDDASARVKQLMKHIEKFIDGRALQPLVKAMMSFRGIQILGATVIAAEIGDLRRFKTAEQFMAFLGLGPSESSSGNSVNRGSLTKTGNGHVRRILIEAAQHYRHRPVLSAALRKRQEGISKEVRGISWKAQQPTDSFHKQWEASQQSHCGAGSRTGGLPLEPWARFAVVGVSRLVNAAVEVSARIQPLT